MSELAKNLSITALMLVVETLAAKELYDINRTTENFEFLCEKRGKLETYIAELESAQRWVPVSERLPELDQDVFAVVEGEFKVGHFYQELDFIEPDDDDEEGNIYFSVFDDGLLVATHWFPIPDGLEEREK